MNHPASVRKKDNIFIDKEKSAVSEGRNQIKVLLSKSEDVGLF